MRLIPLILCVCGTAIFWACAAGTRDNIPEIAESVPSAPAAPGPKQPVLVELFTSEGCSSCPPADRTLAFLKKEQPVAGAEVIALAYHVDYWNYIGWMDRFSSPRFSRRQESYTGKFALSSIYTPQMIVDGDAQFTGSDTGRAVQEIGKAVQDRKGRVEVSFANGELKAVFSDLPQANGTTAYLAVTEDNLSSDVERGENRGSKLQHVAVVRELREIGKIKADTATAEAVATLEFKPEWKRANLNLVAFVQDDKTRNILAVGNLKP